MNSNSDFFNAGNYFIDQKVICSKFYNCFQIFNHNKNNIGLIKQKHTTKKKLLSFFFSKTILPFSFEIRSSNGTLEVQLHRGWNFFSSKVFINNARGKKLGMIKQNFDFFASKYVVFNALDEVVAVIPGNWNEWNLIINDSVMNQIGTIDKSWPGIMKEIFRTSGKYNVSIPSDNLQKEDKILVVSSAIIIGLIKR